jgi:hypothetical protein
MTTIESPLAHVTRRELLATTALAVLTGLGTWLFLGPNAAPVVDSNTGEYTADALLLILSCGATLLALIIATTFFARPLLVVPAVALPFTAAWSVAAATTDDSGLWVIGAVFALIGATVGAGTASAITDAARTRATAG